jgi:hypothetical protein
MTATRRSTSDLLMGMAAVAVATMLVAGVANAGRAAMGPRSADAAHQIKEAILYEMRGRAAAAKGDWPLVHQDLNNKGIGARESLVLAKRDLASAQTTGEIDRATETAIDDALDAASELDRKAATAAGRKDVNTVTHLVTKAIAEKEAGLRILEKATPPPPPPTNALSFGIAFSHSFGAGPSSSNDCESVTVTETGGDITPIGTLNLTGPGGFSMTNPLTFTPSGGGVFVAPSTFLLTSFGTYTEEADITVGGMTNRTTGTWMINTSNDLTTGGCSTP